MRTLLVGNPRTVMGFNRLTKLPNLGLSSLAANLDKGLTDIRIADLVLYDRKAAKYLTDIVEDYKPDVIGFTAMAFQYHTARDLARIVKKNHPGITTILGGYHATSAAELILNEENCPFDYLIIGEGERPFNALIHVLKNGGSRFDVDGLAFRTNGKLHLNTKSSLLKPEEIRLPDRKSRIFKKGFHIFDIPGDVIETSRGCVYNCNFCSIRNMYGKTFRKYSIERIIEDLIDAKRYGAKAIFITDDNITLDGKRYMELCNAIISEKLNMNFAIQASVRGIRRTPGLAEAMGKAGTKWVFLGIESADDCTLEYMHKSDQLHASDTAGVVDALKKNGMLVSGGFIFGNPEDTKETLMNNFEFAKKLKIDIQLFNILTPHLKTEIRDELLAEGLITNPDDFSKYNHYFSNVKTRHLTSEELFEIRNQLDARFPVETGAIFRMFKAYPGFITRLMLRMILKEPKNWWTFSTGFFRNALNKNNNSINHENH